MADTIIYDGGAMDPRALRQQAGLCIGACAKAVKCHPNTWGRLETGELCLPEIAPELKRRIKIFRANRDAQCEHI